MRWGNVFIAEGEDYLISQPLSLVELRFHPVLINVTLLDNGSSGGGREAKFIDITLVQDISYSQSRIFVFSSSPQSGLPFQVLAIRFINA